MIAVVVTVAVFVLNLFLKEVPLRKQHVLSAPARNHDSGEEPESAEKD